MIRYVTVVIASSLAPGPSLPGSSLAVASTTSTFGTGIVLVRPAAIGVYSIGILTRVAAVAFTAVAAAITSTTGAIGSGIDVDRPRRDKLTILA